MPELIVEAVGGRHRYPCRQHEHRLQQDVNPKLMLHGAQNIKIGLPLQKNARRCPLSNATALGVG